MQESGYQTNWKRGMSLVAGFVFLGAVVGAYKDVSELVSPSVSFVGVGLCLLILVLVETLIRTRRPTWIFPRGQIARLTALGIQPRWFLIGFIGLLLAPRIGDLIRQQSLQASQPAGPTVEFRRHPQ